MDFQISQKKRVIIKIFFVWKELVVHRRPTQQLSLVIYKFKIFIVLFLLSSCVVVDCFEEGENYKKN
jgi:hypothetical protein